MFLERKRMQKYQYLIAMICILSCYTQCMDQETKVYNIYSNNPLEMFTIVFKNQNTDTIKKYFEINPGYAKIFDLETGDNLLQQAMQFEEPLKSFITLLAQYNNHHHKNKKKENALNTASRLFKEHKISHDILSIVKISYKKNRNQPDKVLKKR